MVIALRNDSRDAEDGLTTKSMLARVLSLLSRGWLLSFISPTFFSGMTFTCNEMMCDAAQAALGGYCAQR